MRIKRIPVSSFSLLSLCLAALGFGSCQSKKFAMQQEEKRMELNARLNKIHDEEAVTAAKLAQLRNDYENIGRGECVYGGPNNMEEARQIMYERQERERESAMKVIKATENVLDSLNGERTKVTGQLEELDNKKQKK